MKITLNPCPIKEWDGSALIIGIFKEDLEKQIKELEEKFQRSITGALDRQDFNAEEGNLIQFKLLGETIETLILFGLGSSTNFSLRTLRDSTAKAARMSIGTKGILGIFLPWGTLNIDSELQCTGEAIRLTLFKDLRFRTGKDERIIPTTLEFINVAKDHKDSIDKIYSICSGVELARELVGSPANDLTPTKFAEIASGIADKYNLSKNILNKSECENKRMGAFLAVAKGSDIEPQFIHLTYKGEGPIKRRLAFVGKGLTFDSGGYNLKVGASQIELMKFDMGGSAAVIGAARSIAELRPRGIEIHFIVASCENMINGSAIHPGDIVSASNGKTIEINNTDAEGRLTLADALIYASELKPDAIVDLATLTGACVIALGEEIAGYWSENEELSNELERASEAAGEELWRMPMKNSYKAGLKSMLADIKNTGPRAGGSITAALFLKEFVNSKIPWAHIDIAGTVWSEKDKGINPAGATGFGVKTLIEWALK